MTSATNALANLRCLLAAATPGPWRWYWSQNRAFIESDTHTVVEVFDADPEVHGGIEHEADAALIAAAVNALPHLIAVAEAAQRLKDQGAPLPRGLFDALTALHTNAAQDAGGGT